AAQRAGLPHRRPVPRRPAVGQPAPALKMTSPRYQSITGNGLRLLTSDDGGALVRLIAGDLAGFAGPGVTHTPITYAHVTLAPGAQLSVPWNPAFSALAYVLTGRGTAGPEGRPVEGGQLVVFGPGDHLVVAAVDRQAEPLDVHLRMCMSCGHVGCCANSPHRHATAHFASQHHPIIQSYEPGEEWWYCYVDDLGFEMDGAPSFAHP